MLPPGKSNRTRSRPAAVPSGQGGRAGKRRGWQGGRFSPEQSPRTVTPGRAPASREKRALGVCPVLGGPGDHACSGAEPSQTGDLVQRGVPAGDLILQHLQPLLGFGYRGWS